MNENLVASSLFTFKRIAVDIVAPDLEIPGMIAKAWASPIIIASLNDTRLSESLFEKNVKNSSKEVTISIEPTSVMFPVNKVSIFFSYINPIIPTGILETIILLANSISFFFKLY